MSKQRRRHEGGADINGKDLKKTRGRGKAFSKRDTLVLTNQQEIDEIKDAQEIEQIPLETTSTGTVPQATQATVSESGPRKMNLEDLQKGLFLLKDAYSDVSENLKQVGEESVRIHKETNEILDCHSKKLGQHDVFLDKLNEACCDHESRISSIELTMKSLKVKDVVPPKASTPEPASTPAPVAKSEKAKLDPMIGKIIRTETFQGKDGRKAAKGYYAIYPDNRSVGPFVEARLACQASPIGTIRAYVFWLNDDGSFASQLTPAEVAELFL